MKSARDIKHILISLYCRTFGGDSDSLEVWDGPEFSFKIMRKEDGWITTIPRLHVNAYLSDEKKTREQGKSYLLDAFYNFRPPSDG